MSDEIQTSPRLRELLRMRGFLDSEIRAERLRLANSESVALIQAAAGLYGSTVDDIRSEGQAASTTKARMLSCWLLREHGLSYPEIGRLLCVHHTTAMHAVRAINADPARKALGKQLLMSEVAA